MSAALGASGADRRKYVFVGECEFIGRVSVCFGSSGTVQPDKGCSGYFLVFCQSLRLIADFGERIPHLTKIGVSCRLVEPFFEGAGRPVIIISPA